MVCKEQVESIVKSSDEMLGSSLQLIDHNKRYVMFVDDNPTILSLISIYMQSNDLNNFIMCQDVNSAMAIVQKLNGGIEHILGVGVVDLDFGYMGGDANVLIKALVEKNIFVIVYSGLMNWKSYVLPEFHDKVKFIQKGSRKDLLTLYGAILGHLNPDLAHSK